MRGLRPSSRRTALVVSWLVVDCNYLGGVLVQVGQYRGGGQAITINLVRVVTAV